MPLKSPPKPGTRVRLTGAFLKSTGQQVGPEGRKVWTVQACDCSLCTGGRFALTDERLSDEYRAEMWGDLPEEQRPRFRHVAIFNLENVKAPPQAADYP